MAAIESNGTTQKVSESARERAVYTYYNPTDIIRDFFPLFTEIPETTLPPADYVPRVSTDTTLTGLAQLATLRLKAARSIISLIDSSHQYILAEATPTLSLAPGPQPKGADTLWLGSMIIPRAYGLCQRALDLPVHTDTPSAIVVNDLLSDEAFDPRCLAAQAPKSRFYASIPLRTDEGLCIGAVSILDEEPRDGLDPESLQAFQDIAQMIMSYLKTCKLRADQTRGDEMIRGLTSFMATGASGEIPAPKSNHVQSKANGNPGENMDKPFSAPNWKAEVQPSTERSTSPTSSGPVNSTHDLPRQVEMCVSDQPGEVHSGSSYEDSNDAAKKLREKMLPDNAKSMFSRAADAIRGHCNYAGVVIFDSTISTFQGQVTAEPSAGATCQVLGYSSIDSSRVPRCTESDLHDLLEMHPTGKIYNISRAGEVSSDGPETEEEPPVIYNGYQVPSPRRQRSGEKLEADAIRSIAPNARSVVFVPLYDFRRGRWFAGCFCWINHHDRILSRELDLLYLRAFGNTMMTELSRLDAISGERAKTTFVASISHELRSPLHGILGGVEVLQDTEIDDFQTSMVNSIDICGRTLLNTINHVMDFAKINHFASQKVGTGSKTDRSTSSQRLRKRPTDASSLTSVVDLSVTIEETVEAVFVGESYRTTHPATTDLDSGVTVRRESMIVSMPTADRKTLHIMLDIPKRDNWRFRTQPGSWKRILMNLTGNALKYSEKGFVRVSLRFEDNEHDSAQSIVMTVQDSGIGISPEFLQSQLFKPFSQENSFATGTGLGLNIVKQIVDSMGGSIDLKSQQGVGTEVSVTLPCPSPQPATEITPGTRAEMMASILAQTRGKKICLYNRELSAAESDGGVHTEDNANLTDSIKTTLTDWMEMDVSVATDIPQHQTDFVFCTEPSFGLLATLREKFPQGEVPIVVLLAVDTMEAATLRADARVNSKESIVEIITQPCGPYKLAEVLARGLKRNSIIDPAIPIPASDDIKVLPISHGTSATILKTDNPIEKVLSESVSILVKAPLESGTELPIRDSSLVHVQELPNDKPSILIVDDNPVNIRLLVAFMRKQKFHYAEAVNGLEALNTYKAALGAFDFVLMDLSMPIMDGTTSSHEIRKFERAMNLKPTTIIALTGLASATARIEALANGIDHYITKPVKLKKLLAYLQGLTEDPNADAV